MSSTWQRARLSGVLCVMLAAICGARKLFGRHTADGAESALLWRLNYKARRPKYARNVASYRGTEGDENIISNNISRKYVGEINETRGTPVSWRMVLPEANTRHARK